MLDVGNELGHGFAGLGDDNLIPRRCLLNKPGKVRFSFLNIFHKSNLVWSGLIGKLLFQLRLVV